MLAQIQTEEYLDTYRIAKKRGDYIVMDNGAAEGDPVEDAILLSRARDMEVDELVVPDAMGSYPETLNRVRKFFNTYHEGREWFNLDVKFMGVVQGQNMAEVMNCLEYYALNTYFSSIGIPRHFIQTFEANEARWKIAEAMVIEGLHERFEIHLLGTSQYCIDEITHMHDLPIRSVDTSAPYNYTYAYQSMEARHAVKRFEGYFGPRFRQLDARLLQENIETYKGWASGTQGARS
jgi:hypothetical protein